MTIVSSNAKVAARNGGHSFQRNLEIGGPGVAPDFLSQREKTTFLLSHCFCCNVGSTLKLSPVP